MQSFKPSPGIYEHIIGLRVVRTYRQEPIDAAQIERILEAGRWTGSSKNIQPWAFIVLTDPGERQRLAECGSFTGPLIGAPLVVAIVRLPEGGDFDIGRAAQNMMEAAAALGIGSCPVTLHREPCAKERLNVPDDHGCRFAVAFGYPDLEGEGELRKGIRSTLPQGRKPLTDLVHYGHFGAQR
ncbi:MAG: nitroreductase family protein [Acidimicrobiia bacterium]|nr:nitroreductase family protein [Acidimicrobiia bacterium]MDH3398561.1 nitroreductase family protein [Acidimicrobiia bacterium]MDH5616894.1 nitroreductase family protein [Acidimicrobiia bacterium]